ncbi:MAG: hypothetical protein ACP5SH_25135 [Syntrophobacteraceae bacterium]
MSEYQYYEFLAIDRPLGPSETAALRSLSTRAEITSTRFQNTYNFGDFKGSPDTMMDRYFDAHVYVSNWGIRRLELRFSRGVIDREAPAQYSADEVLSFRSTDEHSIVQWECSNESGGWVEGEGWMARLTSLRDEIERGDFRALYLGWLYGVSMGNVPEGEEEPPVPPGLGSLTAAQLSLCEFMGIDSDYVSAAAASSPPTEEPAVVLSRMSRWVDRISEMEAKNYVLLLLDGRSREAERKVRQDYAACLADGGRVAGEDSHEHRRSVRELLKEVEKARAERIEQEKIEQAHRNAEQRKLRERYLCELAKDFELHWKKAHEFAEKGGASAYDQACDILVDLSEAYLLKRRRMEFTREIARFRAACARRGALIRRMDNAGLK